MVAAKKHLRFVFVTDSDWNRITSYSEEKHTSKSDALTALLTKPGQEPEPETNYGKLIQSLEVLQKAVATMEPPKSITFRECTEIYLDEQRRQNKSSTVRTHKEPLKTHILPAFGDRLMTDITRQDILDFQKRMSDKAPSYNNSMLGTIQQIFAIAKLNGYIDKDVSKTIKRLPEPKSEARNTFHRALSKSELDAFLAELVHEHLYLFIMFMLYTGLRQGEVSALTADDIDEDFIYVNRTMISDEDNHVRMGDSPKTKSSKRKIPINGNMRKILDQLEIPTDGSTLFKSFRGKEVSNASVNRCIRNTIARVKDKRGIEIEHFTSHALRDTFATNYSRAHEDKGGDPKTLQELLGHAKMSVTTDLYVHCLDDSKIAGMMRMDSFA